MPDNVMKVADVPKIPVQQVFIGSCTNGSYSDFKKVALVLKEHKINPDVSLVLGISSRQIYLRLLQDGVIADLVDSGARITEFACGPCCGIGIAPSSKGISVRTSNRNFKGRSSTADASLYLVSPEVAAATAVKGTLALPQEVMEDVSVLGDVKEPETYPINDNLFLLPPEDGKDVPIVRPQHQTPAGGRSAGRNPGSQGQPEGPGQCFHRRHHTGQCPVLFHASNMPAMAQYAFCRYDPDFAKRAQKDGKSFIVGGENYGQGSSREHAAITPMYLGVKMVMAKSFARIHKGNLINHGVIPAVFADPAAYEGIELEDTLRIEGLREQMKKKEIQVKDLTKGTEFTVKLELTDQEVEILLAGGKLRYYKARLAEGK